MKWGEMWDVMLGLNLGAPKVYEWGNEWVGWRDEQWALRRAGGWERKSERRKDGM